MHIGGKRHLKNTIIEWAVSKHPDAGWFTKKVKGEVSIVSKTNTRLTHWLLFTPDWKQINTAKLFL